MTFLPRDTYILGNYFFSRVDYYLGCQITLPWQWMAVSEHRSVEGKIGPIIMSCKNYAWSAGTIEQIIVRLSVTRDQICKVLEVMKKSSGDLAVWIHTPGNPFKTEVILEYVRADLQIEEMVGMFCQTCGKLFGDKWPSKIKQTEN